MRVDAETCSAKHRKARWRFRRGVLRRSPADASRRSSGGTRPAHQVGPRGRFAYADPPYPGRAGLYPEGQEVDHAELIGRLEREFPDGWALSTAADALRDVLPLCPPGTRVCVWRRRVWRVRAKQALSAWEPLLVVRGRALSAVEPQELVDELETDDVVLGEVLDYRGRYDAFPGALIGMKPPEFAVWMFHLLGARAGDELADLFPGSGAVGRAWQLYTSAARAGTRPGSPARRDASALQEARVPVGLADAEDASSAAAVDERDASTGTVATRDGCAAAPRDASARVDEGRLEAA